MGDEYESGARRYTPGPCRISPASLAAFVLYIPCPLARTPCGREIATCHAVLLAQGFQSNTPSRTTARSATARPVASVSCSCKTKPPQSGLQVEVVVTRYVALPGPSEAQSGAGVASVAQRKYPDPFFPFRKSLSGHAYSSPVKGLYARNYGCSQVLPCRQLGLSGQRGHGHGCAATTLLLVLRMYCVTLPGKLWSEVWCADLSATLNYQITRRDQTDGRQGCTVGHQEARRREKV